MTKDQIDEFSKLIDEIRSNGAKAGSLDAAAHDGAVMVRLLLQHGVPLETIRHVLTRNEDGSAGTIISAAVDRLCAK
jgi:hypothetical protein